jgi:hypothetical protein
MRPYLGDNNIGNMGCKYLSIESINSILELSLDCNEIGCKGMLHLSKIQWTQLQFLFLCKGKLKQNIMNLEFRLFDGWSKQSGAISR